MVAVLIRADASNVIGSGHVMRCIALAQGWRQAGGEVLFAMANATATIESRLQATGFEFESLNAPGGTADDVSKTLNLARERNAAWIIADGYQFGADYQSGIKAGGHRLLVVDDFGRAEKYSADLILNQNLHARAELYCNRQPETRLLIGTRYALLRDEFSAWRNWQREVAVRGRKILVTLGGSDPGNFTGRVMQSLQTLGVHVKIAVGGSNKHIESLTAQTVKTTTKTEGPAPSASESTETRFDLQVDVPNMPDLMAWADLAVAAGGSTSWELAFMGLPSLVLVVNEHEQQVIQSLAANRLACVATVDSLSEDLAMLAANESQRRAMSELGRSLVDGRGVERVVQAMLDT